MYISKQDRGKIFKNRIHKIMLMYNIFSAKKGLKTVCDPSNKDLLAILKKNNIKHFYRNICQIEIMHLIDNIFILFYTTHTDKSFD